MDRARIQIGRLSRFGLLEMSRQRLRPSLSDSSHLTCPRCTGIGSIRGVESMALAILRLIGEEARKDRTAKVIAQLPVDVATYLMNEKRDWLHSIETRSDIDIVLVPNRYLETPAYEIRRIRDDEMGLPEHAVISHQLAVQPQIDLEAFVAEDKKVVPPVPAVTTVVPSTPAPPPAPEAVVAAPAPVVIAAPVQPYGPRDGIFVRTWHWLFGDKRAPLPEPVRAAEPAKDGRKPREGREFRDARRDRPRDHDGRRDGRGGRGEARRDGARADGRGHDRHPEQRGDGRDEHRRDERRDGRRDEPRGGQRRDGRRPDGSQGPRPAAAPTQPREAAAGAVGGPAPSPATPDAALPVAGAPNRSSGAPADGNRHERAEGERGPRRSRRGGRRRRREHEGPGNGDGRWSGGAPGENAGATDAGGPRDSSAAPTSSFTPSESFGGEPSPAPSAPPASVPEPREVRSIDWSPGGASEGERSEARNEQP
jgi:ribonuclease E